ncbi:hypothetical protein M1N56_06460 [Dehalococcoidia bacterium]|nr:hypothetical protein [Dehalococcoidia bacterium]
MSKIFTYEGNSLELRSPLELPASGNNAEAFYHEIYSAVFEYIAEGEVGPQIDVDNFREQLGIDPESLARSNGVSLNTRTEGASNPDEALRTRWMTQIALREFLKKHYHFKGFFKNICEDVEPSIRYAEWLFGDKVSRNNFVPIKRIMDDIFSKAWDRERDVHERNSGNSILGTESETLVKHAMEELLDDESFFKVTNRNVSTYGDFVLMCLPNNLWISCKSGFSRERLMASGFDTDILGVTFLKNFKELRSENSIKNYQKVGFLAIYIPDTPVDFRQLEQGTSTFEELRQHYGENGMPLNVNKKPFIRPLSAIFSDLGELLSEPDLRKRVTAKF